MKKIAIIGGGISGLVTAYRLSQSPVFQSGDREIHVYESSSQFGGVIQTDFKEGFLIEQGPDAFLSTKPQVIELCQELGLEKDLIPTNPKKRQSFILSNGQLVPTPQGFYLMTPTNIGQALKTPLLSFRGKSRMVLEYFIPPKKEKGDESLASFVRRRFGKEVLERIAQPMIAGIYAANPEELSLEATFPQFLDYEQEYGSVIRGFTKKRSQATKQASGPRYSLFLGLKKGTHSLIQALLEKMPQVQLHPCSKILSLSKEENWKLTLEEGESYESDIVCLASSSFQASKLLEGAHGELSAALKQIPYESVATLSFAFRRDKIEHPLNGLGYVVPARERKNIIGCTFSSIKFSDRSQDEANVLLRAFVGGSNATDLFDLEDDVIKQKILDELKESLGITDDPLLVSMRRWPHTMPQRKIGHRANVQKIFSLLKEVPNLYLTGNAYEGIGIPDCIQHATQTADRILENLSKDQSECQNMV